MTTTKTIAAAILLSLAFGTASAQQSRRNNTTRVTVSRDEDDDTHVVVDHGRGVIDGQRFYHTPYRTRNSGSYDRDTRILSVGFGLPNTLRNDYGYYGGGKSGFGPLLVKYEMAIRDEIGIGAVVDGAYAQWKYNIGGHRYRDNAFGIGVSFLGYYHFNKLIPVRDLDVYGGVGVNISHVAYHDDFYDDNTGNIDVLPAFVIGARYYFRPDFGPYFEIGRTNYSWVNLGLSFGL